MKRSMIALLCVVPWLFVGHAAADPDPEEQSIPLERPERPFLLVQAQRRFLPSQDASVTVQSTRRGVAEIALFRVRDGARAIGLSGRRQGVSIAQTTLGDEAERLLSRREERGSLLELVSRRRQPLAEPRRLRHVADETQAYDSYEGMEGDVATWGVDTTGWAETRLAFGRLPAGMYLARVHMGPFASTALLSVGELVLIARRGDVNDVVFATDAEGRAQVGLAITARVEGSAEPRRATTDEHGVARFDAVDAGVVRFEASSGDDFVFTDVAHARLDACDPRVYVATGRPYYRPSETIHLRGHVRGCDAQGGFGPVAGETIQIFGDAPDGEPLARVTSDRDGNFIAEVPAQSTLTARLRGRDHPRTVGIDARTPPRRALTVAIDRRAAGPGDVVRVRVQDEQGGWPVEEEVALATPWGQMLASIGPRRPATFTVAVPREIAGTEAMTLTASLATAGTVTMASGTLVVGRDRALLSVVPEASHAIEGAFEVTLRGETLTGDALDSQLAVAVYSTDGNTRGGQKWTGAARLRDGQAAVRVTLEGAGPWWIEATSGRATAHTIVWDRERPSTIGRGDLAITPARPRVQPGDAIAIALQAPARGRVLVTLEQGGVLASRIVSAGTRELSIDVPRGTTGRGNLVATHIDGGVVRTATSTLDIATSRDVDLTVSTERTGYAEGERVHVTLQAASEGGRPTSGVATLWFSDAGYWDMGEETYPLPGEYLQRPGRMASPGDSSRPRGFGAEEGRVLRDASMTWDGERVPGTTYRHGWSRMGELVTFDIDGPIRRVANELARRAGLTGAEVCESAANTVPRAHLTVRDLPWDLVAEKMGDRLETTPWVRERTLVFDCGATGSGYGFGGLGAGGSGAGGGGFSSGTARTSRLLGTIAFIGLVRLDRQGRFETDLEMPRVPGRYRIEALVIADDGGGDRAHRVLHVERPLAAFLESPDVLREGDVATAELAIESRRHARQTIDVTLRAEGSLAIRGDQQLRVALDDRGMARARITLASQGLGDGAVTARIEAGSDVDEVIAHIETRGGNLAQPVELRSLVGPDATAVHLALPPAVRGSRLAIELDGSLLDEIDALLATLEGEQIGFAAGYVERLTTLNALGTALDHVGEGPRREATRTRLSRMQASASAALLEEESDGGGFSFWSHLRDDPFVTARAILALEGATIDHAYALERHANDEMTARVAAEVTLALAMSYQTQETARSMLERVRPAANDIGALTSLALAEHRLGGPPPAPANARVSHAPAARDRLRDALEALVEQRQTTAPVCTSVVWFACFRWLGESTELARAAIALVETRATGAQALAARIALHLSRDPVERGWASGSDEAALLALRAVLEPRRGSDPITATIDGSRVAIDDGGIAIPDDAQHLVLELAPRAGRFRTLRVRGEVELAEVTAPLGNVGLRRSFEPREGGYAMIVAIDSRAQERDVSLRIPLPAGLAVHPQLRAQAGQTAPDRVVIRDDAIELGFARVSGRTTFEVPLVALGGGDFAVPPAMLRAANGRYGVAPGTRINVP